MFLILARYFFLHILDAQYFDFLSLPYLDCFVLCLKFLSNLYLALYLHFLQKQNQNVLCAAIQHFDFLGSHYYYQSDTQTYFKIVVDDDNHVIVYADETSFLVEFVDKILDMFDRGYTFNSIQKYIENVYSKNYDYMGRNRL